jgi:hypothetical protein
MSVFIFVFVATLQTAAEFGTRAQSSALDAGGSARKSASPHKLTLQEPLTTRKSLPVISFG